MKKIFINNGKEPVIYIRYYKEDILYIGETSDSKMGRPFRKEKGRLGDWDKIRLLKASNDRNKRKWWEAWLICKLKPKNQRIELYKRILDRENFVKECEAMAEREETYVSSKKQKAIDILEKLRKKNNKERSLYWGRQIELAEQHKKQAISFFKHFYNGYLQDRALEKKENSEKK